MTRALCWSAAAMAIMIGLAQGQAIGQAIEAFEVATIKPSAPDEHGATIYTPSGERFTAANIALKGLIALAWDVRDFQISGGPAWLDSTRYDVAAKAEAPADLDHMKGMLQPLLTERFRLAFRREVKDLPVYALVIGKNGPKLRPSEGRGPQLRGGKGQLTAQKIPISMLAAQLGNRLGRPVLDRTGLTGDFDIILEWTPMDSVSGDGPSIFTAVQEQLGLKLEPGKGSVEIIVVDHPEQPREN
jgi:uncharacterized protein (TIGR03435 family)